MYQSEGYKRDFGDFEVKKFADKLKYWVCMLTGCTIDQLEDNTYKETPLGPEWDQVNPIWTPVKEMEMMHQLYNKGESVEEYAKKLGYDLMAYTGGEVCYKNERRKQMTPRLLLQLLGTECGRKIIHPNIWVNALMKDYVPEKTYIGHGDYTEYEPSWIITDVRFENEARAIKERGGIILRINRNKRTSDRWQEVFPKVKVLDPDGWDRQNYQYSWFEEYITLPEYIDRVQQSTCEFKYGRGIGFSNYFKPDEHESETALDNYPYFDAILSNDGSVQELEPKVKEALINLKLLK